MRTRSATRQLHREGSSEPDSPNTSQSPSAAVVTTASSPNNIDNNSVSVAQSGPEQTSSDPASRKRKQTRNSTATATSTSTSTTTTDGHDEPKSFKRKKPEPRRCPICLETTRREEVSKLNGCSHRFCFPCIDQWSERENTCPLCKARFTMIERVHKKRGRKRKQQNESPSSSTTGSSKRVRYRDQGEEERRRRAQIQFAIARDAEQRLSMVTLALLRDRHGGVRNDDGPMFPRTAFRVPMETITERRIGRSNDARENSETLDSFAATALTEMLRRRRDLLARTDQPQEDLFERRRERRRRFMKCWCIVNILIYFVIVVMTGVAFFTRSMEWFRNEDDVVSGLDEL